MHIYSLPAESDITGIRNYFDYDDEQMWQEKSLYSKRHEGKFVSRLEQMQDEWLREQEDPSFSRTLQSAKKRTHEAQ